MEKKLYSNKKGFTLIEVLIAIVLLVVGLLGTAGIMTNTMQQNNYAARRTEATTVAQDELERILALPFTHTDLTDLTDTTAAPVTITYPDPIDYPDAITTDYTLGYTVTTLWSDSAAKEIFKEIQVIVTWADDPRANPLTITMSTILGKSRFKK